MPSRRLLPVFKPGSLSSSDAYCDQSVRFSHPASLGCDGDSGASVTHSSTCGAGVLSPWMSEMLQGMRLVPAFDRLDPHGSPAPAASSLEDLYDPSFGVLTSAKWRDQLLLRPPHCRRSPHDVAEIVMSLEEGPLSEMVAFCDGEANATRVYLASEGSGIWSRSPHSSQRSHEQIKLVKDLARRLDRAVIQPVKELAWRLTRTQIDDAGQQQAVKRKLEAVEDHLRYLVWLYEKALMTPAFACVMLDCIVTERVAETKIAGVREDQFDTAQWCIAFDDGVFDIRAGRLLRDGSARTAMQTRTVGYSYESMVEGATESARSEYDAFMGRIFSSSPASRRFLVEQYAASAANINLQALVFHFNLQGSNGKTTVFSLARCAFGGLMVKCSSSLLVASSVGGGPNEELASIKGMRAVQVTEPSALQRLSVSTLKELTGGDEQSARRCHDHKHTFVFNGTVHVACNKIPGMDDMDGGLQRRLRIIPYGSRFLPRPEAGQQEGGVPAPLPPHHYYRESGIQSKFDVWRLCMMREILDVAFAKWAKLHDAPDADWHDGIPPEVTGATATLIQRESTVAAFCARRLRRSVCVSSRLRLRDAVRALAAFCARKRRDAVSHKDARTQLTVELGEMTTTSCNGVRNFWRGWELLPEPPIGDETDDDEGVGGGVDDGLGDC